MRQALSNLRKNEPRRHKDTKRYSWLQNDSANLAFLKNYFEFNALNSPCCSGAAKTPLRVFVTSWFIFLN